MGVLHLKPVIRRYYYLTKPGLIYGNLLTVVGGYLYGAITHPQLSTLLAVTLGSGLVMASGTVLNNIQDRSIDKHMKRTKRRATVTGTISPRHALVYATILAVVGVTLLAVGTNRLTTILGVFGLVMYAGIYTYAKPRTVHATLIGAIPGAVPPVAGYIAATNSIDASFWILAAIMISWQMVHFYAIALFRQKEYAAAGVPVLPVIYGAQLTTIAMIVYACLFVLSLVGLALYGYAGLLYLAVMLPLAAWWLLVICSGINVTEYVSWAKKVFFMSLFMLPALCITLALNAWAP